MSGTTTNAASKCTQSAPMHQKLRIRPVLPKLLHPVVYRGSRQGLYTVYTPPVSHPIISSYSLALLPINQKDAL